MLNLRTSFNMLFIMPLNLQSTGPKASEEISLKVSPFELSQSVGYYVCNTVTLRKQFGMHHH
jgi:hypothetical protein